MSCRKYSRFQWKNADNFIHNMVHPLALSLVDKAYLFDFLVLLCEDISEILHRGVFLRWSVGVIEAALVIDFQSYFLSLRILILLQPYLIKHFALESLLSSYSEIRVEFEQLLQKNQEIGALDVREQWVKLAFLVCQLRKLVFQVLAPARVWDEALILARRIASDSYDWLQEIHLLVFWNIGLSWRQRAAEIAIKEHPFRFLNFPLIDAIEHLSEHAASTPHVHALVIPLLQKDNLRSSIKASDHVIGNSPDALFLGSLRARARRFRDVALLQDRGNDGAAVVLSDFVGASLS